MVYFLCMVESNNLGTKLCPNCNTLVEEMARKSIFYNFYRCPNCKKTFRVKKEKFATSTILEHQVEKIINILYLLVAILIIYIIIDVVLFIFRY